jgi:hypothetical protein
MRAKLQLPPMPAETWPLLRIEWTVSILMMSSEPLADMTKDAAMRQLSAPQAVRVGHASAHQQLCLLLQRRLHRSGQVQLALMVHADTTTHSRVKARHPAVVVLLRDTGERFELCTARYRMLTISSGNTEYECSQYLGW